MGGFVPVVSVLSSLAAPKPSAPPPPVVSAAPEVAPPPSPTQSDAPDIKDTPKVDSRTTGGTDRTRRGRRGSGLFSIGEDTGNSILGR